MNWEELAENIGSIMGIVIGISIIILLIITCVFLIIYEVKFLEAKKEYMKSKTKEERQIINDYLTFKETFNPLKKDKKE